MPNLNKVLLMGNLTRDPELRYTPNNLAIAKIGLAINRRWRNQQGEQQDETTFVDCDAFGKTAEMINQYMKKGRPIFIEGRLRLDQWQDKEGNNRSRLMVVIENFQFVDTKAQAEAAAGGAGNYSSPANSSRPSRSPAPAPAAAEPHEPIQEGEIPF